MIKQKWLEANDVLVNVKNRTFFFNESKPLTTIKLNNRLRSFVDYKPLKALYAYESFLRKNNNVE